MAKFMNEKISGITVPESWGKNLEGLTGEKAKGKCVEMTGDLLKEIAPMCQGVHFMPLGWSDLVPKIIDKVFN
jgi:5,10-methylenetetrahydrofolate reductase